MVSLFDKIAGESPATLLKGDSSTSIYCKFLKKFEKHLFYRVLPIDTSELRLVSRKFLVFERVPVYENNKIVL